MDESQLVLFEACLCHDLVDCLLDRGGLVVFDVVADPTHCFDAKFSSILGHVFVLITIMICSYNA